MPTPIKTIAIPAFSNATIRYKLAALLPEDITREFLSRTRYAVITDASRADAVLTGSVANFSALRDHRRSGHRPGRGEQGDRHLEPQADGAAHRESVVFAHRRTVYRPIPDRSRPLQYFDESDTAMARIARNVAQSVVAIWRRSWSLPRIAWRTLQRAAVGFSPRAGPDAELKRGAAR